MSERLLQRIVDSPSSSHKILEWLDGTSDLQDESDYNCSRSDFSLYFVNYIRVKTQGILNSGEVVNSANENQNSEISNSPQLCEIKSIDSPINSEDTTKLDQSATISRYEERVFNEKFSTPLKSVSKSETSTLKTPEFSKYNDSLRTQSKSDICDSSSEKNSLEILATPNKNASLDRNLMISPITPVSGNHSKEFDNSSHKFSTPTPKLSYEHTPNSKYNTSNNRRTSNQRNICIADFMTSSKNNSGETSSTKKKRSRFQNLSLNDPLINTQNKFSNNSANDVQNAFNINDEEMFPNTLSTPSSNYETRMNGRNNRRRIKPTKLNNSFPSENTSNVIANGSLGIKFGVKYDKPEQNDAFKIQNCQIAENSNDFETERDILKKEKVTLIQKFNQISTPKKILANSAPVNKLVPKVLTKKIVIEFDVEKVENVDILNVFSSIFSLIIDSNLIPNIISEMYYLISLVMIEASSDILKSDDDESPSTNCEERDTEKNLSCDIVNVIFENIHNVVFFALSALEKQKLFLNVILDKNSLRFFLKNNKIRSFSSDFADSLSQMLVEKVVIDDKNCLNPIIQDTSNKNVYFISETDNADNFPTKRDFLTFKSQRDCFYEIFREWEVNHQLSGWTFDKIISKIKSLVNMGSSPSNLIHLSRLFKAQLLVSCTEKIKAQKQETIAHLQSVIGSCGVNQDKLKKLTERLTAALPEQAFSVNQKSLTARPDFTRHEEFFKNFILCSNNSNFRDHLINAIIQEIYKLEESGCTPSESDDSSPVIDKEVKTQYLDCLRSLRILAKFLGFLMSLPYDNQEAASTSRLIDSIENKENSHFKIIFSEISVRNLTLPPIDLIVILINSYRKHRLILTIPWIVQLLAMLDHCSLRLLYFKKLHQMLFDIFGSSVCKSNTVPNYQLNPNIGSINQCKEIIIPNNNKSLIRICLGWLFDLQNFPRDLFYTWLKYASSNKGCENNFENHSNHFYSFVSLSPNKKHLDILKSDDEQNIDTKNNDLNEDNIKKMYNLSLELKEDDQEYHLDSLEIIDHNIITEVCPYLKDFRILFLKNMKSNNANENNKNIRHITPVTSSINVDKSKKQQKELQIRLEEWFLRSQPGTTRRMIELVSERTGAALVRLAKTQIPTYSARAYNASKDHINNYVSEKNAFAIAEIYNRELLDFHLKCKRAGQHIASKRVRCALQGLLPPGTHSSVQEMCIQICTRNAIRKLIHFLETQYNDIHVLFEGNNFLIKVLANINNDYFAEQRVVVMHQFNKENVISIKENFNKSISIDSESNHIDDSKNYDDTYYSTTLVLIELKECVIEILSGLYSENELRDKVFTIHNKIYECSNYSYVDKSMKNIFLQLLIDLTMLIVFSNPSIINEEYLSKASKTWLNCHDYGNSSISDIKPDPSNLEITYFEKLMGNEFNSAHEESSDQLFKIYHNKLHDVLQDQNGTSLPIKLTLSSNNVEFDESILNEESRTISHNTEKSLCSENSSNYFNTILCSRNLTLLRVFFSVTNNKVIWTSFEFLLIFLIKNNFLTKNSLVEQFVAIYRQDWPQDFLSNLSDSMKRLINVLKLKNDKKLLMLEFMSEYCEDLDSF